MADLRALIFDWDGTLADSVLRIVRAMQAAADLTELPRCSDRAVKDIIGLGLPEAISTLYPTIDADQAEVLRSAYSGCYLQLEQTRHPCSLACLTPSMRSAGKASSSLWRRAKAGGGCSGSWQPMTWKAFSIRLGVRMKPRANRTL